MLRAPRAVLAALVLAGSLTAAPARAADAPPRQELTAVNALPPGQSGHFSPADQAAGTLSGDPDDYGEHVDDQREMFWAGRHKPGDFAQPTGTPQTPRPGVRIYRDGYGVPLVYGDTGYDVWFGAGYAAGQDRLFLADAVRRLGRGTFGELAGPSFVPDDVRVRVGGYTDTEYAEMLAALPPDGRAAIEGYSAGLDAWITQVRTNPTLLPMEYVVLSSLPEPWTLTDTMAAGVYITRYVASHGLLEPEPLPVLRALDQTLGREAALTAFADLFPREDPDAVTTIPASEGRFSIDPVRPARRDAVYRAAAAYALSLPQGLDEGPGTGAYPAPPGTPAPPTVVTNVVGSLRAYVDALRGGSFMFAVAPERTSTGGALLMNGPQLGYSYPTQLWELEVHGGGYDARGVSVPSLPTVGIGYGERTAWGLTTGYSRTIDSFVETTRRQDGRLQYFHDGAWKDAQCRTETVRYRSVAEGAPVGPPVNTRDVEVCRTVHGPIVATAGMLAHSVRFAVWKRDLETVTGLLAFNAVDDYASFARAVGSVTWNENVVYADADGHIAYWHPGLHPRRSPNTDPRFPSPGTGSHDWSGLVPREQLPHVVDPAQGYLANWNSQPAHGWTDALADPYSIRPAGPAGRINVLDGLLRQARDLDLAGVQRLARRMGAADQRWLSFRDVVALARPGATAEQRRVLDLLAAWNGDAYGPGAGTSPGAPEDDTATDGPAPTIFRELADRLRDEIIGNLPAFVVARTDAQPVAGDTYAKTSHVFDATTADNLVLRVLGPHGARPRHDWLRGRDRAAVVRAALDRTIAALREQYGADPAAWRAQHPRRPIDSLTGVVGPSVTMPYLDRGSWEHIVALGAVTPRTPRPVSRPPSATPRRVIPTTGLPAALPLIALLAVVPALRRVRRTRPWSRP